MDNDFIVYLGQQTLVTGLKLAAPMLVVGLAVGVVMALVQAVTSVREMTLAIIPKLLAVAITLIVAVPWMVQVAVRFTWDVLSQIGASGSAGSLP